MLGMPSGSSLHCTADDIKPSGSSSPQPLDISIDISLSALTLKGVTFHLHTMLIKIHPYVLKERGDGSGVRGHSAAPFFEMREMRAWKSHDGGDNGKKDLGSLGEGGIIWQCPIFFPLSNRKTVCSLAHGPQQFDSGVPACDAR